MDFFLLLEIKRSSKNLNGKNSQKLLDHAKQSASKRTIQKPAKQLAI